MSGYSHVSIYTLQSMSVESRRKNKHVLSELNNLQFYTNKIMNELGFVRTNSVFVRKN